MLQSSDMLAYNELQPVALHQPANNGNNNNNYNNAGGSTAIAAKASIPQNIIANAGLSYEDVLNDDFQFDMDGHDVMVFLHIQKTGGTSFGRHLVRDLDLKVSIISMPNVEHAIITRNPFVLASLRVPASAETLLLLPSASQRELALLQILDRLEVWPARRLDRADELCGRRAR